MKNTLERINSKLGDTEESIIKLENRTVEITKHKKRKKFKKQKKITKHYIKDHQTIY